MTNILLFALIGMIFLVAWFITNKKKKVHVPDRDTHVEKPHAVAITKKHTKYGIVSRRLFVRKYPRLPRKKFYRDQYETRKREHSALVDTLAMQGITWTPVGLYWATHQLAVDNKK